MGHGDFGERLFGSAVTDYMFSPRSLSERLIRAVKCGHLDGVHALLNQVGNVPASYIDGQDENNTGTALYWASCYGYEGIVRVLIEKGADVSSTNSWRATPLHAAADNNHVRVCSVLIKNNADVNAQTAQGDTPCHLAAYRGCKGVVEKLLHAGADLSILNHQGKTCLDEARGSGHFHTLSLMEAYSYMPSIEPTYNFAENFVKDGTCANKCKTIYECTEETTSDIFVVPSSCSYHTFTKPHPACSEQQLNKRIDQSPHHPKNNGAFNHAVTAHTHRHASWAGTGSEYEAETPNNARCERRTSDSDVFVKQLDTSSQDISLNFNSMDYEEMKGKRYNKDKWFS